MKKLSIALRTWIIKKICPHQETAVIFTDWQDRCWHTRCKCCGKEIFEPMPE